MNFRISLREKSDERGIALMELGVAIPFFLMLIIGVIDIGRMVNQYLLLNYAVKTGVLNAMSTPGLATGSYVKGTPNQNCPAGIGSDATADTRHQQVQERMQQVINMANEATTGTFCIRSALTLDGVDSNDPYQHTVSVEVQAKYNAFFPMLKNMPMKISATGPYLVAGR